MGTLRLPVWSGGALRYAVGVQYGMARPVGINSTAPHPPDAMETGSLRRRSVAGRRERFVSMHERGGSVQVIALDKQPVNTKISSTSAWQQMPVFTGIYHGNLLHNDTYSPNIRLAE